MKGHISGGRAAHAVPVLPVMHGFVDLQMPTSVKLDDHVRLNVHFSFELATTWPIGHFR